MNVLGWYWGRKGGGALFSYHILEALSKRPNDNIFVSVSDSNDYIKEIKELTVSGLHIQPTYQSIVSFILKSPLIPFYFFSFRHFLIKNNINVVISTMPHLWSPFFIKSFKKLNIEYIPITHDPIPHQGEKLSYPQYFIKSYLNNAVFVVTLSKYSAQILSSRYSIPATKIITANIPSLRKATGKIPLERKYNRPFRFLFFGRIRKYKGLELLFEAYRKLKLKTSIATELSIVGSGALPKSIKTNFDQDITIINKWSEDKDIEKFFTEADVIVLPYISASQSGIILDAMAYCKPCIITPVGGLTEQVIHEETGYITEDVSADSLTKAMNQMLDQQYYSKLVKNLNERADVNNYSYSNFVDQILNRLEHSN